MDQNKKEINKSHHKQTSKCHNYQPSKAARRRSYPDLTFGSILPSVPGCLLKAARCRGQQEKGPWTASSWQKHKICSKCKLAVFSSLPTPKGVVGLHRDQLSMSVKGNLWTETPPDKIKYWLRWVEGRWHKNSYFVHFCIFSFTSRRPWRVHQLGAYDTAGLVWEFQFSSFEPICFLWMITWYYLTAPQRT